MFSTSFSPIRTFGSGFELVDFNPVSDRVQDIRCTADVSRNRISFHTPEFLIIVADWLFSSMGQSEKKKKQFRFRTSESESEMVWMVNEGIH